LPLLGAPFRRLPWFVADVVAPAGLAAGLTVLRIDGRTFHQTAWALLSLGLASRRTVALGVRPPVRSRWRPPDLVLVPDGSEPVPRRFRYRGPGAVLVMVAHRTTGGSTRVGGRRAAMRLLPREPVRRLRRGRVIAVERRTTLRVGHDHAGAQR